MQPPCPTAAPPSRAPIRAGFCAIVGLPNVGKSTLLNRVLGRQLVAVSPKPQTTRNRILGVKNELPTSAARRSPSSTRPGVQHGRGALRRYMRDAGRSPRPAMPTSRCCWSTPPTRGQRSPERARARPTRRARGRVIAPQRRWCSRSTRSTASAKPDLLPLIEALGARTAAATPRSCRSRRTPATASTALERGDRAPAACRARAVPGRHGHRPAPSGSSPRELIREQLSTSSARSCRTPRAVMIETFERAPDRGDVVDRRGDRRRARLAEGDRGRQGRGADQGARHRARAQAIAQLLGYPVHLSLYVKVSPELVARRGGAAPTGLRSDGERRVTRVPRGRDRRPAQRRQVDPVQPAGRRPARRSSTTRPA